MSLVTRRRHGTTPDVHDVLRVLQRAHARTATGRTVTKAVVARRIGAGATAAQVATIVTNNSTLIVDAGGGVLSLSGAGQTEVRKHPAARSWSANR